MAKANFRHIFISWVKIIFIQTLGRWGEAYGYAKRFYGFIRMVDKNIRIKILLAHTISIASNIIFLLGSLSIIPFVNYVIDPESVHRNQWLDGFYTIVIGYVHIEAYFIIVLGVCSLLLLALARAFFVLGGYISQSIDVQLNVYYVTKLYYSYISQAEHKANLSSSEIVHNISSRLPQIIAGFVNPVFSAINNCFFIATGLVVLFFMDPRLMIVAALGAGLFLFGSISASKNRIKRYSKIIDSGKLEHHKKLLNSVAAREYIQMSGKESVFARSFAHINLIVRKNEIKMNLISMIFTPIGEIIIYSTMVLLSFYVLLVSGRESISYAAAFLIIIYRIFPAVNSLFGVNVALRQGVVVYDQVSDQLIRALSIHIPDGEYVKNPLPFKQSITIRNTSYRYPDQNKDEWTLKNINLTVPKGIKLGICGDSGGGKTSLLRLLTGRIKPTKGSIKIDKRHLNNRAIIRRWQDNIGYVTQNLILVEGTLAENIALNVPGEEIDKDALFQAIKLAELRPLVNKLPGKENFVISESGSNISGGQRQRIVVARALYSNPSVLILDEATSSLDKKTEAQILTNIYNHWKGEDKSIIFVTHRLDTIKHCDLILMVQQGEIKARGTYKELIKNTEFLKLATSTAAKQEK